MALLVSLANPVSYQGESMGRWLVITLFACGACPDDGTPESNVEVSGRTKRVS